MYIVKYYFFVTFCFFVSTYYSFNRVVGVGDKISLSLKSTVSVISPILLVQVNGRLSFFKVYNIIIILSIYIYIYI